MTGLCNEEMKAECNEWVKSKIMLRKAPTLEQAFMAGAAAKERAIDKACEVIFHKRIEDIT